MHKVSLRQANAKDIDLLKEIYAWTRPDVMENPNFGEKDRIEFIESQFNLQDVHYRNNYPNARFMIIKAGGLDRGRLYLHKGEKDIRIMDISILPSFRGKGTGSIIIRELQSDASASDKTLSIHVEENNPAKSLYKRLGFKKQGEKINGVYQLMVWCPK